MREKGIDRHLPRRRGAHEVDRFPQRAFQHRLPKEPDHPIGLTDRFEPRECRAVRRACLAAGRPAIPRQLQHAQAERQLLTKRKVTHAQEQRREMQWRRKQSRGRALGAISVGADEPQRAVAAKGISQTGLPAEIEEVGAAAHRHVLAGIDQATRHRVLERGGSATSAAAGLQNGHADIGCRERRRRRKASQTTTDDDNVRRGSRSSGRAEWFIHHWQSLSDRTEQLGFDRWTYYGVDITAAAVPVPVL